jgi:hypothetical protein
MLKHKDYENGNNTNQNKCGRWTGHWHIKVNPSEVSVSLNIAA